MNRIGAFLWNLIEKTAHFFVFGFLGIFHKKLTDSQWEAFMQFVKFGLVGLSNTLLTYVVYAILVTLGLHYQLSNVISYAAGIFNSYYWNNKYVFQEEEGQRRNHVKALAKVFASYGFTFCIGAVLLYVWVDVLGISSYLGPVINLLVTIPLNFILNKLWAFHER